MIRTLTPTLTLRNANANANLVNSRWKQSMIRTDFDVSLGSGGKSGAIVGDAVAMPCAIIGDVATPCAIIGA